MKTAEAKLGDPAVGAAGGLPVLPVSVAAAVVLAKALMAMSVGATKVRLSVVGCSGRMMVLPVAASETRLTYHTELDLHACRMECSISTTSA
jgi:hypothetical protein